MFLINENDFGMPDNSTDVHIEDGDWDNLFAYNLPELKKPLWFNELVQFLTFRDKDVQLLISAIERNEMVIPIRHPDFRLIITDRIFGSLMQPFLSSQFAKFTGMPVESLPNDLPSISISPNMMVTIQGTKPKKMTELMIIMITDGVSEMIKGSFDLNEIDDTDISTIVDTLRNKIKEKRLEKR
jgi:hypothetical protein